MVQALRVAEQATQQAVEGRHRPKKFRNFPTASKVMLVLFFDLQDPLLCHFMRQGESIISARYSDILCTDLRRAIKDKRPGRLNEGVILLQDNARPYTAQHIKDTIRDLRWKVLDHSPYNLDLSPCDFHIVSKLKSNLGGRRFATDGYVMEAVQQLCHQQPKDFYEKNIKNLVYRWDRCLNSAGDYFEK